jgi:hypothetical protein
MRITLVTLALSMMLCCSKKEDNSAKAKIVYDESMRIHDGLMPSIDEMYLLEGELKSLRDTLLLDSSAMLRKLYCSMQS